MPDTPHQRHIKETIQPGSVYYYHKSSINSSKQHNFIVLNVDPSKDSVIVLVCSQSNIQNVKKIRNNCPPQTLIEITPNQYSGFTKNSIIDCNSVFEGSIEKIADILAEGKLQTKPVIGLRLVKKLRDGVILSPIAEKRFKILLQTK